MDLTEHQERIRRLLDAGDVEGASRAIDEAIAELSSPEERAAMDEFLGTYCADLRSKMNRGGHWKARALELVEHLEEGQDLEDVWDELPDHLRRWYTSQYWPSIRRLLEDVLGPENKDMADDMYEMLEERHRTDRAP